MTTRIRKKFLMPICMSPSAAAEAMGLRRAEIAADIRAGLIPLYQRGMRRRILVADLCDYVRKNFRRAP
jgi:hypothetical protein